MIGCVSSRYGEEIVCSGIGRPAASHSSSNFACSSLSVTTDRPINRSGAIDRAYCTASMTPRCTEPTSTTTRFVRRGGL